MTGTPRTEELRTRIERTRDDLGHTVEALVAKADIPARAHERAARTRARLAARSAALAPAPVRAAATRARRHPKAALAAAAAVGLAAYGAGHAATRGRPGC